MSGNPYEDSEPMDPDEANTGLLAELRAKADGPDADGEDGPEVEEVVIGAPVEDEDPEPGESPRQAKRRRRGEEYQEQQREKNDEASQLREELAELRGQLTGMQSRQVAQQPQGDRRSEFDDRREAVKQERRETLLAYQNSMDSAHREKRDLTDAEKQSFFDRNDKSNTNWNNIDFDERDAKKNTPQTRARNLLVAQYPDVMDGGANEAYATNLFNNAKRRGEIKDGDGDEATRRIIDKTRRELKLSGYKNSPEASDKQRSSYGSMRGTGERSRAKKGVSVVRDSPQWDMAMAFSSHMSDWTEAQKLQHWVNETKGS